MAIRAVAGICSTGMTAGKVAEEDEDEEAQQERRPAEARLAEGLHHDALFDELDRGLREVAGAGRRLLRVCTSGQQEQDRCRSAQQATAMSATLLKDGKMSCQRRISLIGREDEATFSEHVEFPFQSWDSAGDARSVCCIAVDLRDICFQTRLRQRQCDVLHLPKEETKMSHDDGRSKRRK